MQLSRHNSFKSHGHIELVGGLGQLQRTKGETERLEALGSSAELVQLAVLRDGVRGRAQTNDHGDLKAVLLLATGSTR